MKICLSEPLFLKNRFVRQNCSSELQKGKKSIILDVFWTLCMGGGEGAEKITTKSRC